MTQEVYVQNGNPGMGLLAFLLAPPLIPPGYLVVATWRRLSALDLHPLYKIVGVSLEIAAIIYALKLFYQYMPRPVAIAATMIYMSATYGWGAQKLNIDQIWTGGIVVAVGIAGYFIGRELSGKRPRIAGTA